jgi:hemerythrin-like domain-containing protein
MPLQIGSKASNFTDPTGLLTDCHRRIEMFLNALRTAAGFGGRKLSEQERSALDAALRYFREAAPKHNADEEDSLFPRLRGSQDPEVKSALAEVIRLEQEHRWAAPLHDKVDFIGREWLVEGELKPDQVRTFQSAVEQLAAMYRTHIEYEDRVLFPLAARVLSPAQTAEVAKEMAKRRNLNDSVLLQLKPLQGGLTRTSMQPDSEGGRRGRR